MPVRAVMRTLLAVVFVAALATPALACKGAESLLRDDFTDADPAWAVTWPDTSSFDIGGGKLAAKNDPGTWASLWYNGAFFPAADACVDITLPDVRDPSNVWAGLIFWSGDASYVVYLTPDAKAGVWRVTNAGWLSPVPAKANDAIKTGQANTLRVVWSGPPAAGSTQAADPIVHVFVNDQEVFKFKVKPNDNRQVGLAIQSEGDTFEFSNLSITQ
ncbi:MAG: family 16 glycoside hydrolase [Bryobacteraceae bacterium]